MLTRLEKEKKIQALEANLKKAKAGFLVDFKKLNVQQITEMRKELGKDGLGSMAVYRNTLILRALADFPEMKEHLAPFVKGSNAFVFAFEDPSKTAKVLQTYVKKTEILKIKTGVMDNKKLPVEDIKMLANLPSLEVLRAQFLSALSAPLSKMLAVCSAGSQGFLRALSAFKDSGGDKKQ